jgi:hypothetical protein
MPAHHRHIQTAKQPYCAGFVLLPCLMQCVRPQAVRVFSRHLTLSTKPM